jgi:hypothetical protein
MDNAAYGKLADRIDGGDGLWPGLPAIGGMTFAEKSSALHKKGGSND